MTDPRTVGVLVLAGGEARRLGGVDKPLVRLDDRTILSHLLGRLPPDISRRALSANGDAGRFRAFGLPVLADRVPGLGPLAGLREGLEWAAGQELRWLLTVPGDTPFIPRDLWQRLDPGPSVACSAGRRHHLVALWPVAAQAALARHLAALSGLGRSAWGIQPFARSLGAREVWFSCEPEDPFLNVNTPEDLDRARRSAAALR
ncbi:molybdenum cofactor guanylyltransferase [Rhizosaccharibacter radicis]|uniref:Molybdenum cofactor guanylyltransferase n=1 Tax=Rhizosaccharibacter radicis TaxID=2782605 RepID=A0ABT1VZQ6_9PROT|nr:NTP transferase domain-containing protein [Acetobacteraceae bacterium KSS12]